ncbi:S8 family serine peptidase [bacterium]|nr:S8 family serine peptidase [bacterium]
MKYSYWVLSLALGLTAIGNLSAAERTVLVSPKTHKDIPALKKISKLSPGVKIRDVFARNEKAALRDLKRGDLAQSLKVTFSSEEKLDQFVALVQKQKLPFDLDLATEVRVFSEPSPNYPPPTDPLQKDQWAIYNTGATQTLELDYFNSVDVKGVKREDIRLDRAPPLPNLAVPFKIALLDTGVDVGHPDLVGQINRNEPECKLYDEYMACTEGAEQACGINPADNGGCIKKLDKIRECRKKYFVDANDLDRNHYPLDCNGWNVRDDIVKNAAVYGSPVVVDPKGHGTHCAGVIAAGANGQGIQGCAPNVKIIPVKVLGQNPNEGIQPHSEGDLPSPLEKDLKWSVRAIDLIARGILYAVSAKADVISMSFGWTAGKNSPLTEKMIALAQKQGVMVVSAAGNDNTDAMIYPCIYPGVVCVASHDMGGALSSGSNYGMGVDLAAPGVRVLSTWPTHLSPVTYTEKKNYEVMTGTSMATPYAACGISRLRMFGFDQRETFARLLAGTRPSLPPQISGVREIPKYTRSGNLDITGSFEVKAQPLILPVNKKPYVPDWHPENPKLVVPVHLVNRWAPGKNLRLRARLISPLNDLKLEGPTDWSFAEWNADEVKTFVLNLSVVDRRFSSELLFEFEILAPEYKQPKSLKIQAEVRVPVGPDYVEARSVTLPILPNEKNERVFLSDPGNFNLMTVSQWGRDSDDPTGEYLAITESKKDIKVQLLRQDATRQFYTPTSVLTIPVTKETIRRADRVYINGKVHYILAVEAPATAVGQALAFRLLYLDENFNLLPQTLAIPGNAPPVRTYEMHWMSADDGFWPGFVVQGDLPEDEKPKQTLRQKKKKASTYDYDLRFYYQDSKGVHTIPLPDGYYYQDTLVPTSAQKKAGIINVLVSKPDDDSNESTYYSVEIQNRKLGKFIPLELDQLVDAAHSIPVPVVSVGRTPEWVDGIAGDGFLRPSYIDALTVSFLAHGSKSIAGGILPPLHPLDVTTWISGGYLGDHTVAAIAQTTSRLQYHDFLNGDIFSLNLRKFSFLPDEFSASFFTPLALDNSKNPKGDRLGALYVPLAYRLADTVQIMAPKVDSANRVVDFVRPAAFRFDAVDACISLNAPTEPTSAHPSQLGFFCGDRIIHINLVY